MKTKMNRQKYIAVIMLFLIFIALGCSNKNDKTPNQSLECNNCNVIIIGLTVLRADHLGSYGYLRNTTPNIDNIAAKSFVFRNAISSSSWTLPSFMSIFTSTYPSEHGVRNRYVINKKRREGNALKEPTPHDKTIANLKKLSPDIRTLAEVLNKNNYATSAFTGNAHLNRTYGHDAGFNTYYDSKPFGGFETTIPLALKWLGENKDHKFFLFVHGYDIHGRYELQKDSSRKFMDKNYHGYYTGAEEEQITLRNLSLDNGYVDLSEEDKKFWIDLYDSKLYDADQRLGKFFFELKALGILNNSIIIIMGDHGEELFERNRIDHGFSLYDELIHVPLIIYIPYSEQKRFIDKKIIVDEQVRTIDIMPTILDVVGINLDLDIKNQMKGTSLVPLVTGQHLNLDAISETDYIYRIFKRSLRKSDGWKFIYSLDTDEKELYNLNEDPEEKNNLIDKEPRMAYELEQELFRQMYGG